MTTGTARHFMLLPLSIWAALALPHGVLAETKVGIYFRPTPDKDMAILGYEGTKLALEENGYEENVTYVSQFSQEALKGLNVLILACVHGYPKEWKEGEIAGELRAFVEGGGGLLLMNESMGWRRALSKNPPFPEIGRGSGKGDPYMNSVTAGVGPMTVKYVTLEPVDKEHPVVKGIEGELKALHDMPDIAVGEKGQVLLRKKEGGGAAVVAGALGKGRVVLMAPTLGVGLRNMEEPPSGSSMKLLLNVVRWLGGT